MSVQITMSEAAESVTGFDEIAIEKHLDVDLYTDGQRKPMLITRALIFVHLRHNGANDPDAKAQVMGMSVKDVGEYFADDPDDDVMPEEPESESGKDDSGLESEPLSSLPSAS